MDGVFARNDVGDGAAALAGGFCGFRLGHGDWREELAQQREYLIEDIPWRCCRERNAEVEKLIQVGFRQRQWTRLSVRLGKAARARVTCPQCDSPIRCGHDDDEIPSRDLRRRSFRCLGMFPGPAGPDSGFSEAVVEESIHAKPERRLSRRAAHRSSADKLARPAE